jgi:membrane protein implicated in regulation of membrane protease activity
MISGLIATVVQFIILAVSMLILYWVIRLAVRHALEDHDTRRRRQL